MEEMGFLGPFLVQLGAPMKWAGLEMPKCVAVHQRVKYRGNGCGENSCPNGLYICLASSTTLTAIKLILGNLIDKIWLYKYK